MSSKAQSKPTPSASKAPRLARIGSPLTTRLRAIGCVFCPACFAFMFPDHDTIRGPHINLVVDLRVSRDLVVLGGAGETRLVNLRDEAQSIAAGLAAAFADAVSA